MEANGSTMTAELDAVEARTVPLSGPARLRRALNVRRTGIVLKPSNGRVVIRPFEPASDSRVERIIAARHVAPGA